jgi:hypothetical protein
VAGYAGVRPRPGIPGRRGATSPRELARDPGAALPRRRVRGETASRARRRSSRTGILVAGIVVLFTVGFASLAQTVRVSANAVERDQLDAARQLLLDQQQQIRLDLYRLGREPAVRKQALDAGLGQLVDPLIVPAR